MNVNQAAELYISRGWQVVPLSPGKKDCYSPNWQTTEFTAEDFSEKDNIGIKSVGGIVDIDLDCDEVVAMADAFLPQTLAVYGRKSKPRSHRIYRSKIDTLLAIVDAGSKLKSTLIEIRVNHQSMAPPSIHPDGENIEWELNGDAYEIGSEILIRSVRLLATAALIARYYAPKGMRHMWLLPLAGFIRTLGLTEDEALKCVRAGGSLAKDDEINDRMVIVKATYARAEDQAISGVKDLVDLVDNGKQLVNSLNKAWGTGSQSKDHRGFALDLKGNILASTPNVELAFKKMTYSFSYDEFSCEWLLSGIPLDDARLRAVWFELEKRFRIRIPQLHFKEIVMYLAESNKFHPVKDYLKNLEWDKTKRVDRWLINYGKAEETQLNMEIGRIVLVAAVRRVRHPGCKFDEILMLRSGQGMNKSEALKILCPKTEWFTESLPLGMDSKVVIERTLGIWIVEAAELVGKTVMGTSKIKNFLSTSVDGPARMAYSRVPVRRPRHFIIIGTCNPDSELPDPTGNRRWWPVDVEVFNLEGLKKDRDQLWAEASYLEKTGTSIRLKEKFWERAAVAQEEVRKNHPWENLIEGWMRKTDKRNITYEEIYDHVLFIPIDRRNGATQEDIKNCLLALGYRKATISRNNIKQKGWIRSEKQKRKPYIPIT